MPIKMELAIREGWKATDNSHFGEVLEVRFINEKDGKVMFRYAPRREDEDFWKDVFVQLYEYDSKLTELRSLILRIDGRGQKLLGECFKEAVGQNAV